MTKKAEILCMSASELLDKAKEQTSAFERPSRIVTKCLVVELGNQLDRIAELEQERNSTKNLVWFSRDELRGLDPEQTGIIDLTKFALEQQAKVFKAGFWRGFEVCKMNPDNSNILGHYEWQLHLTNQAKTLGGAE